MAWKYPSVSDRAFIVTGPTSGLGLHAARALAAHGTIILLGRNCAKLRAVKRTIERGGGRALLVLCDIADLASVRRAATEIADIGLAIFGLLNNAGAFPRTPRRSAQGWDMAFATNHLGPFALTEALSPHLIDGGNVVFVSSSVEDRERRPAVAVGFRGGRYISAEASGRSEWLAGGSRTSGSDAYATSKQCILATAFFLAREVPRLHFNAVEPGFIPATNLARDSHIFVRLAMRYGLAPLSPFIKHWTTPKRAGHLIAKVMLNTSNVNGMYYNGLGRPMLGSKQVEDEAFQNRVVCETRAMIAAM